MGRGGSWPIGKRDDGFSVEAFALLQRRQQCWSLSQGDGLNDRNRKLAGPRDVDDGMKVVDIHLCNDILSGAQ